MDADYGMLNRLERTLQDLGASAGFSFSSIRSLEVLRSGALDIGYVVDGIENHLILSASESVMTELVHMISRAESRLFPIMKH